MTISLSALRQKLFELADRVVASGEPLSIERKGVQLKLIRVDRAESQMPSRLVRLQPQSLVLGAPLAPNESPSAWQDNNSSPLKLAVPKTRKAGGFVKRKEVSSKQFMPASIR